MSRESTAHTFFVAGALCVVCSVLVSGAAVQLKPTQETNRLLDKKKNDPPTNCCHPKLRCWPVF